MTSDSMHVSIAFAAGIALALFLFPIGFLLGSPSYWENIQGDTAINWIAYVTFAHDEWRWPILRTVLLNPPNGTNIFFSDPIPLFALVGKLVFKTTGYLPNYLGPWVLLSYGLQPAIGYLVLREGGLTRLASLIGGGLFLLVPTFIFRIGHLPLLGHWILLVALLMYLRIVRAGRFWDVSCALGFTILLVLVNPYLLAMVTAIYLAGLGDGVLRRKLELRLAVWACALLFVGLTCSAFLFGIISLAKSVANIPGFGHFSMNALSPVWPQLSAWLGSAEFVLNATGGQYEGFNYLGAGLLLLFALALVTAGGELLRKIKQHILLTAAALLMALYALSSKIYVGDALVATLPYESLWPLGTLTGIFRSSGRFFWPMCYFLLFLTVFALFFRFGPRRFELIALAAIGVQLFDIRPLLQNVSSNIVTQPATAKALIDKQNWEAVLSSHDELTVFPQYSCAKPENATYVLALGKLAAVQGIPANSTLDNRANINCAAESAAFSYDFRALATRSNPLVVAFKNEMNAARVREASTAGGMVCRDAGFAYVCSSNSIESKLAKLGGDLKPPPTVRQGEVVGIGNGKRGSLFLTAGWAEGDGDYVWGVGPVSSLSFTMAEPICGPAILSLRILPFEAPPMYIVDRATIVINHDHREVVRLSGPGETMLNIPFSQIGCTSSFDVTLNFSGLRSPQDFGVSRDPRYLSWRLISFSVDAL